MLQWKRTILNTGVTFTVVAAGALAAEGVASAHDVAGSDGVITHAVGKVTTLGTESFIITTHDGTTETISTTPTTTFAEAGTPLAPTGVTVGEEVFVSLDPSDATPTAVHVSVLLDRVSGKVVSVTGASITLSARKGATRQVVISPSTEYFSGMTTATGVTTGEFVTAFGNRDTTTPTELDALFVDIASTSPHPARGPWVSPSGADPKWGTPQGGSAPTPVTPSVSPVVPTTAPSTSPVVPPAWSGATHPGIPSAPSGQGSHGFSGFGSQNGSSGHSGAGESGAGFSDAGAGAAGHGGRH